MDMRPRGSPTGQGPAAESPPMIVDGGAGNSANYSRPDYVSGGSGSFLGSGSGGSSVGAAAVSSPPPLPVFMPRPIAMAFSAETAKVVHFVRHGQGYHNVEAALLGPPAYKKQSLMDARLDETGVMQATTLGERIREARMIVDVVLVSPLTRTLETASLMFPQPPHGQARVPFVAVELCREAHGGHPCDQRRPVSTVAPHFPHVDFSGIGTDADTWHNPDRRETVREVSIRCDKFIALLRARSERNLVVVSHGVFLETLLNRSSLSCTDESIKGKRFENVEMRSVVIGGWSC